VRKAWRIPIEDARMFHLSNSFSGALASRARFLLAIISLPFLPVGAYANSLPQRNVVIQWNNAALLGVRDSKLEAPMVARALAIVHTCMFDALKHSQLPSKGSPRWTPGK
jgi:hypothetical protein